MINSANYVFFDTLKILNEEGEEVSVRAKGTKEKIGFVAKIDARCPIVWDPIRDTNIEAQLIELYWTLGGSNNIKFLSEYMPNAANFSDNGITWRAGYGPRLLNWNNTTNQIQYVVDKLLEDPYTRQAVISLWDPEQDKVRGSKDYPCNNIVHFMLRDTGNEQYDMHVNVYVRSNDLLWGFSHIDVLCWAVLAQTIENEFPYDSIRHITLHWHVGSMHYYTSSNPAAKVNKLLTSLTTYNKNSTKPFIRYPTTQFKATEATNFMNKLYALHEMFMTCNGDYSIPLTYASYIAKDDLYICTYEYYTVVAMVQHFICKLYGSDEVAIALDCMEEFYNVIVDRTGQIYDVVFYKLLARLARVYGLYQVCNRLVINNKTKKHISYFM